jgi:hypothetical protein
MVSSGYNQNGATSSYDGAITAGLSLGKVKLPILGGSNIK